MDDNRGNAKVSSFIALVKRKELRNAQKLALRYKMMPNSVLARYAESKGVKLVDSACHGEYRIRFEAEDELSWREIINASSSFTSPPKIASFAPSTDSSPLSTFKLLFNESIIDFLLLQLNHQLARSVAMDSLELFTRHELLTFICLSLWTGIVQLGEFGLYWRTSPIYGSFGFEKYMTLERYNLALNHLCLSSSKEEKDDSFFEMLNASFRAHYSPSSTWTLNEDFIDYDMDHTGVRNNQDEGSNQGAIFFQMRDDSSYLLAFSFYDTESHSETIRRYTEHKIGAEFMTMREALGDKNDFSLSNEVLSWSPAEKVAIDLTEIVSTSCADHLKHAEVELFANSIFSSPRLVRYLSRQKNIFLTGEVDSKIMGLPHATLEDLKLKRAKGKFETRFYRCCGSQLLLTASIDPHKLTCWISPKIAVDTKKKKVDTEEKNNISDSQPQVELESSNINDDNTMYQRVGKIGATSIRHDESQVEKAYKTQMKVSEDSKVACRSLRQGKHLPTISSAIFMHLLGCTISNAWVLNSKKTKMSLIDFQEVLVTQMIDELFPNRIG